MSFAIDADDLKPENLPKQEEIATIVRRLVGLQLKAYHDHRRDEKIGPFRRGTGGEERWLEGSVTKLHMEEKAFQVSGSVAVAVVRLEVRGRMTKKCFKGIGEEYESKSESFDGQVKLKVKLEGGVMKALAMEIEKDAHGMMTDAMGAAFATAKILQ